MKTVDHIYINGKFIKPHGTEVLELINPSTKAVIGKVTLADEQDAQAAIAAAKAAYKSFSQTTKEQRMEYLQRLHDAVAARSDELLDTMIEEYGGPHRISNATTQRAANSFLQAKELLKTFDFVKHVGISKVVLEPLGVVGLITPWNANYGFICSKLAMAIAAGSTTVIKPSELSSLQTQLLTECLHAAGLPAGVFNIVTGRGATVGAEITRHPDIAKISFTGSTDVGKTIARGAVETMKRVTLELGGKSPNVILDDADLEKAIPIAIAAATVNSGQACMAGTRLIVPESRLEEVKFLVKKAVQALQVGDPRNSDTAIGPMVTQTQYDRVQRYIRLGVEEGAELLVGGAGHPAGLDRGYFVQPTVFTNVTMDMRIAKEEIFGPVLAILSYKTEAEAIDIANDTVYGLHAFVSSSDIGRANKVAAQIVAGRVFINGMYDEPRAPFGGFKQSGIGREFGTYGLEAYLEPKAVMGHGETSNENAQ
ncbi:aldehyde dehydrogenase family protein [Collimonas fungivorans]|uniref:Aldehyde dehydrogenase family protein n=1 Tax=Collimonas fungivorans TaxID=158899 RepID=A0A127P8V5_9BURK|nr:aldehyde dehydrogenase family protein [Collimonas fungivorans]AMO94074.1 aldehyde dehydrogenase family protein [Collimonas fungivorans]